MRRASGAANRTRCLTATLRHAQEEEQVRSRWLVGCNGASSLVRHGLKLSLEGSDYEETFLLADVQIDWDLLIERAVPDGR
ncbi:MAG: FAD-dependent monooxygenase [Leptolyngbya sp. BL-A-14]